ncbi:MAG: protein kinase, partial [Planctomycetes bacterium]|nr:protein kinase [Planctomycetota bacterium]
MNDPKTTLLPEDLEERAAIAFLESFVADAAFGHEVPLAEYLAAFPRFEERIAREWMQLRGHLRGDVPGTAARDVASGAGATIGPYRLLSELGRGAQGVVYLAEDPRLGRRLALKVLQQDVRSLSGTAQLRLQREAEVIARLEHEGIARVYEHGNDAGVAWIAMQYVAGGSVQELLRASTGPPRDRAAIAAVVRLVERAARALAVAHGAGILHRDIKPANLLLKAVDEPVLVDFGLAADERATTPTITVPGAVFGTVGYLAPERLAGAAADARGDVYSLGAVLFELLTGRRPYEAEVMTHELKALADAAVPDVRAANSHVPKDLAVVVATAIAKVPLDRYASAIAFADDLARVLTLVPARDRAGRAAPPRHHLVSDLHADQRRCRRQWQARRRPAPASGHGRSSESAGALRSPTRSRGRNGASVAAKHERTSGKAAWCRGWSIPGAVQPWRQSVHSLRMLPCGGLRKRREPETGVLFAAVREEWNTFVLRAEAGGERSVPRFCRREVEGFVRCGILGHGLARVHCAACRQDCVVAFSCKGRGFCPSCGARRMADTAAWLVDRVIPEVPVRQWVLSLPYRVRHLCAYDADVCAAVRRILVRAVSGYYERWARRLGKPRPRAGAVAFVQRFDSALRVNLHFHVLWTDGVFAHEPGRGRAEFCEHGELSDADVGRLVRAIR